MILDDVTGTVSFAVSMGRYLTDAAAAAEMNTVRLERSSDNVEMDFRPDPNYPVSERRLINANGLTPVEWANGATYLRVARIYDQVDTTGATYFEQNGATSNRAYYADREFSAGDANKDTISRFPTANLYRQSSQAPNSTDQGDHYVRTSPVSETGATGWSSACVGGHNLRIDAANEVRRIFMWGGGVGTKFYFYVTETDLIAYLDFNVEVSIPRLRSVAYEPVVAGMRVDGVNGNTVNAYLYQGPHLVGSGSGNLDTNIRNTTTLMGDGATAHDCQMFTEAVLWKTELSDADLKIVLSDQETVYNGPYGNRRSIIGNRSITGSDIGPING